MDNILVIDIGNTSTKFAVACGLKLSKATCCYNSDISLSLVKFLNRNSFTSCLILFSNRIVLTTVVKIIKAKKIKINIVGKDVLVPIKSLYSEELGQDRRVVIFSAVNFYGNVGLVISAGTALVFDFISSKRIHQGGFIFPGVTSSLNNLLSSCEMLPGKLALRRSLLAAKDTNSALSSGILNGYKYIIAQAVDYLHKINPKGKVILTGGDSKLLRQYKAYFDFVDEKLNLKGLAILSSSSNYLKE